MPPRPWPSYTTHRLVNRVHDLFEHHLNVAEAAGLRPVSSRRHGGGRERNERLRIPRGFKGQGERGRRVAVVPPGRGLPGPLARSAISETNDF